MRKWIWLFVPLFAFVGTVVTGAHHLGEGMEPEHAYIGADKCKLCHNSSKKGAQYDKWKDGPHARAYETLGSDEAKKIAAEKGISNPQEADECLSCHVTGWGAPEAFLTDKWRKDE